MPESGPRIVRTHESGARVGCKHRQAEEAPSPGEGLLQRQPGYRARSAEAAALREPQRLRQEAAALEASSSALEGSKAKQASPWVGWKEAAWDYLPLASHLEILGCKWQHFF